MLTTTDPQWVVPFVHQRINGILPDMNLAQAIGFVEGNSLVAGVTYQNFNRYNIEMSVAVVDGFQWSRKSLNCAFSYPFEQLQVNRVTALVECDNSRSQRFVERLGFTLEARLKHACWSGDLLLYRLLRSECRWLRNRSDGCKSTDLH